MIVLRLPAAGLICALIAAPFAEAAPLEAVCLADHPVIAFGERVAVRVLTDTPRGTPLQVEWSTNGGTLSNGSGSAAVTWRPTEPATKTYSVRARVAASSEIAECSAQITVTDNLTRGNEERIVATRSLLLPGGKESPGYGLYSYLLFNGRPQSKDERDRMETLLESFVLISPAEILEKYHARSELNATYVPIASKLPDDFEQREDKSAWLRNHYDFERAVDLLLRLTSVDGAQLDFPGGGVWMVSCLHPLSGSEDPHPILVQNLSAVPPRLIPVWMNAFKALTTQPRFYDRRSFKNLSLDLRIAIGQLADGLEPVASAFKFLGGHL